MLLKIDQAGEHTGFRFKAESEDERRILRNVSRTVAETNRTESAPLEIAGLLEAAGVDVRLA